MRNLEKRLFYFLLDRWATDNYKLNTKNGVLCLTKNHHLLIRHWKQS